MNEEYVRRRLALHSGEPYKPGHDRGGARRSWRMLVCSRWCAWCPAEQLDPQGTIPIAVDVSERPLHARLNSALPIRPISGSSPTAARHDRNLFGNAEQLNITAGMNLGGSAVQKPGYNFGIQFIKPDFLPGAIPVAARSISMRSSRAWRRMTSVRCCRRSRSTASCRNTGPSASG